MRPWSEQKLFRALVFAGFGVAGLIGPRPALAEDPGVHPHIDVEAMHEAMDVGVADDHFASARAYAYYLRAMLAADDGDHAAAVEDLREAEIYDPDSTEVRVALAEQLERVGDLVKAEEELHRSLQKTPRDEPTLVTLGRVLAEEKKLSAAVKPLQKALQLKPDDVTAANALAQVDIELGQEDQAIKIIDVLGKAAPLEASGYKFLGQLLAERGEPKRAERLLRLAISKNGGDVETHESLASSSKNQNRLAEAAAQYEQALGADAEEPNVLLAAGSLALRRSDPATAKAYFDQLLSVMPDDVDVKVKMAFAWFGAHRVAEAAQLLDEARRSLPLDARLAFYAGLVHEEQKSFDQAAEAFASVDHALELGAEAELHLGICLSLAGHHAEAIAALKRAQAEHPDYRAILVALADAYARSGQLNEGIELLQRTAQLQQADELYTALAELYERSVGAPKR